MSSEIDLRELLLLHSNLKRKLYEFSREDLKKFPLVYLIEHAHPIELLLSWSKLPSDYIENYYLQIKLPCFIHYNVTNQVNIDHVDSPPISQSRCPSCKLAFK